MQIVKHKDISVHSGHDNSTVDEYYMDNKDIDVCVVHVNGRTPKEGKLVNSEYKCVCYVLSGDGEICGQKVAQGDAFNILAGDEYWFNGVFSVVMCGTPAFNPAQNKNIKEN